MRMIKLMACAGLALAPFAAQPAAAQVQELLLVPRLSGFGHPGQNPIMAFDAHDGSLVDAAFIRSAGAEYVLYYSTGAAQVGGGVGGMGGEIWVTDQFEHVVFRFDPLGNFLGTVRGNMNNTRGLAYHDGTVYICNIGPPSVPPSLVRFDTQGTFLGEFHIGMSTWDVLPYSGDLLVSHSAGATSSLPDITRWDLLGTPLGTFHDGDVVSGRQLAIRPSNGNVLLGGGGSAASGLRGIYEYDSSGVQVNFISVPDAAVNGAQELGNGNLLYTTAGGVYIYNTTTGLSTQVIAAQASMYIGRFSVDASAVGACCLPDGSCEALAISACGAQGGTFRGEGIACSGPPAIACPQPGACCIGNSCSLRQPQACADLNGVWYGAGTMCPPHASGCLAFLQSPNEINTSLISTQGAGFFLDLTASEDLIVHRIDYFPRHEFGGEVIVDIWTRPGTHVGFIDNWDGGWTHTQSLTAISTTGVASDSYGSPGIMNPTRLMLDSPIEVAAGQTVAVYLVGTVGGVRMRGASGSVYTFSNDHLEVFANTLRDSLFSGTVRTPRGFGGRIYYSLGAGPPPCYANCDGSTTEPILTVDDFTCFINEFATALGLPHEQQIVHYANCDGSTTAPVLTVDDFTCFINAFAAGCP